MAARVAPQMPYMQGNEELVARLRERREFVRAAAPIAVAYRSVGEDGSLGPGHAALVMWLSVAGARLLSGQPLRPGEQIHLDLPIPSMVTPSALLAEALRCEAGQDGAQWVVPLRFLSTDPDSLRHIARYVEERVAAEHNQTEHLGRRLNLLEDLARFVHGSMAPDRILAAVVDVALELARAESGSLLLLEPTGERLDFAIARGPKAEEVQAYSLAVGEGIAGWVALHGRSLALEDASADDRWQRTIASEVGYPVTSLAAVPLRLHGLVVGVLEVLNRKGGGPFAATDLRVLEALGAQASVIIENSRLYRDLEATAAEARARVSGAAEKLTVWRRAAEGNMSQAVVCVPLDSGAFLTNEAARLLLDNLGPHRASAEEKLRALLDDVRLVAPAAVRTSGSYLIHDDDPESPLLMAYVTMLLDADGEPGAISAHLLDMRPT